MKINRISILGAGNVSSNLASSFHNAGVKIIDIYSKNIMNAKKLAEVVQANPIDDVKKLNLNIDLLIVAVKDEAIEYLQEAIPDEIPIVHTSGSIPIAVFNNKTNCGILYPLQTFTKGKIIDIKAVPFLIETNNDSFEIDLIEFVQATLSSNVRKANSEIRSEIHLAAVFANNFTTELLLIAQDILAKSEIELDILRPLMLETIDKSFQIGPRKSLTGPAIRNDRVVMNKHLKRIDDDDIAQLYQLISSLIQKNIKT